MPELETIPKQSLNEVSNPTVAGKALIGIVNSSRSINPWSARSAVISPSTIDAAGIVVGVPMLNASAAQNGFSFSDFSFAAVKQYLVISSRHSIVVCSSFLFGNSQTD